MSWSSARVALALILTAFPSAAAGSERLCDPAHEDCRAILLELIRNETVGIDVAFWFMQDFRYSNEIVKRAQAGVPVRVLVDTRANASYSQNADILAQLAAAGIPMRRRIGSGILHWKMMLFAGQRTVEFSGANYSPDAFVFVDPYRNYVDEAIFFSDDPAVVQSFMRRYDDLWMDTTSYTNYANVSGSLARRYAVYPIDAALNFPPLQSYRSRAIARYNAEPTAIDTIMYRITDNAHTDAVIAAVGRGVPVRLITEQAEYRNPDRLWHSWNVDRLYMAGVQIRHRAHLGLNHQKSVVLRGQRMAIFGSSNWTSASSDRQEEHNYFTGKSGLVSWFEAQFDRKWNNLGPSPETQPFQPLPPDNPAYASPANGAAGVASAPVLTFDAGPFAHLYDIYLGVTPDPPRLEANVALGPTTSSSGPRRYQLPQLVPNMTYYWRVVAKTMALQEAAGPVWSFTTRAGTQTGVSAATHDLNGDRRSDLIWQHASGSLAAWYMDGTRVVATPFLSVGRVTDLNWRIAGSGDLDGNGVADLVWQHVTDGSLAAWFMSGTTVVSTQFLSLGRNVDLNWEIRGVGDLDGDGKADLVWQHMIEGSLALWSMNGAQVTGTRFLSVGRVADSNWRIAGAGDINGDGKADIIWQHHASGQLGAWLMNGATVLNWGYFSQTVASDISWKLRGVGDLNGDGRADLIWQHAGNGYLGAWFMDGYRVLSFDYLSVPQVADTNWLVVGPG